MQGWFQCISFKLEEMRWWRIRQMHTCQLLIDFFQISMNVEVKKDFIMTETVINVSTQKGVTLVIVTRVMNWIQLQIINAMVFVHDIFLCVYHFSSFQTLMNARESEGEIMIKIVTPVLTPLEVTHATAKADTNFFLMEHLVAVCCCDMVPE